MPKRTIIYISVFLILFIGAMFKSFIFSGQYPIKNHPSNGSAVIAFGDSLIVGVGASEGHDLVSELSNRVDVAIVNKGVSGNTTRDALLRLEDDVLKQDPKVVMILLGGNDFIQKIPRDETFTNLASMIDQIQERGGIVLLLGIQGGLITDGYDKEFKKLAKEKGAAYVSNVLNGVIGNPEYMSDPIHPNDAGYLRIADRISHDLAVLVQ